MRAHLFFICLFFYSIFLFSQGKKTPDVFEDAYVVTLKGDTIKGHIKMPKAKKVELFQKISFRDKATNKVRLYTPDKINGYGHNNYYFISAYHNNKSCYFKVLSKGKASLFQTNFEVVEEGIANELEEFCVMEDKSDGQFKVIDEKGIKKQLKDFFRSNKLLVQKIDDQKEIALKADVLENYFNEFNKAAASN